MAPAHRPGDRPPAPRRSTTLPCWAPDTRPSPGSCTPRPARLGGHHPRDVRPAGCPVAARYGRVPAGTAREAGTATYTDGVSTVDLNRAGVDSLIGLGEAAGVASDVHEPLKVLLDRRSADGHGQDSFSSVYELLRGARRAPGTESRPVAAQAAARAPGRAPRHSGVCTWKRLLPNGRRNDGRPTRGGVFRGCAPYILRPRVDPPLASLLGAAPFLHSLVDALGSPLNVLLPESVAANAERFRAVYRRHRLAGRVYFAHKANRSSALVRRLAAEAPAAVGVDVALAGRTAARP